MSNILIRDFKFKDKFVNLTQAQLDNAFAIVEVQFSGVNKLWGFLPPLEADAKRELCFNYLIAWMLTNLYPGQTTGVASSGAMPLSSKKAGPIFIKYRDSVRQSGSGVLESLTTNEFGIQALMMIQCAPECYMFFA